MKHLLFLLISFTISAQIKGVVKDSISGKPIPYVNIWVENENIGTTSEENGAFEMNVSKDKNLIFSAVGYERKTCILSETNEIVLKPIAYQLEEVVISKPKYDKEIEIGNYKNIKKSAWTGVRFFSVAKYFKHEKNYAETPYIKTIIIETKNPLKKAKFNLRLIESNKDGFPKDSDILEKNIIVEVKKGKLKTKVDVSKHNIKFPINGLFVVSETLDIKENEYEFNYTVEGSNTKHSRINLAPTFIINLVDETNTYIYNKGIWNKLSRHPNKETENRLKRFNNKVYEPAISVILSN